MTEFLIISFTTFLIYLVYTLSLNLQWGETGLMNLGPVAFMSAGGYVYAILTINGLNPFAAILLSLMFATTSGAVIGFIGSNLDKEMFGLLTLALANTVFLFLNSNNGLTGGSTGLQNYESDIGQIMPLLNSEFTIFLVIAFSTLSFLVLLGRTTWGRSINAVRESEKNAKSMALDVRRLKTEVMALGSFLSGLAGIMLAINREVITPHTFGFELTLYGWLAMILGGTGNYLGTLIGTFLVFFLLNSGTRFLLTGIGLSSFEISAFRIIVISSILILLTLYKPEGILGDKEVLTIGR